MRVNDFKNILGQMPKALKEVQKLEAMVTPQIAQFEKHRKDVDPELMKQFDEQMQIIKEQKQKLKDYGVKYNK